MYDVFFIHFFFFFVSFFCSPPVALSLFSSSPGHIDTSINIKITAVDIAGYSEKRHFIEISENGLSSKAIFWEEML